MVKELNQVHIACELEAGRCKNWAAGWRGTRVSAEHKGSDFHFVMCAFIRGIQNMQDKTKSSALKKQ